MKAHFIASVSEIDDYIDVYKRIVFYLGKNKVSLTSDWLDEALIRKNDKEIHKIEEHWPMIYRENREAVSRADIIVAEISSSSFLVGFQVAYALQMKKPTLLLSSHSRNKGAVGLSHNEEIVKFSRYDESNLEAIISSFVRDNTVSTKDLRFNFFIDRKILNYLNWASFQTGETKSEIIRRIIGKEIDSTDF